MEQVDCCRREDIPSVARLHMKVGVAQLGSVERAESYYNDTLFGNPSYDKELPSLVIRSEDGEVKGFIGVMPRRMIYKGRLIRMAVTHDMMVDPDYGSPMAIMSLVKKVLNGPQDLVLGDSTNHRAKKVFEAMGVGVSHLYSMYWVCLMKPFQHYGRIVGRKRGFRLLWRILQPACAFLDLFVHFCWRRLLQSREEEGCSAREEDCCSLLLSMNKFFRHGSLHPEYTESDFLWLKKYFDGNTFHGQPKGIEVLNGKGQRIGSFVYQFSDRVGCMSPLFYWAREGSEGEVFNQILQYALSLGAWSVSGRMAPKFMHSVASYPNRIRFNHWVVSHARDPEISDAIHRGDAELSELDGEFLVGLSC